MTISRSSSALRRQKIGADRVKNRSIWVEVTLHYYHLIIHCQRSDVSHYIFITCSYSCEIVSNKVLVS